MALFDSLLAAWETYHLFFCRVLLYQCSHEYYVGSFRQGMAFGLLWKVMLTIYVESGVL